jgi:hypothetical protein
VLSALAHADLGVATTAIDAISPLHKEQRALYLDLILTMLPATIRRVLEAQMLEGYKFTSEFALRHYGEGEAEGLKKGREAGLRTAVLALARAKLLALSDDDVAAIEAATDQSMLTALVAALGNAPDAGTARAALDRALAS